MNNMVSADVNVIMR